MRSKNSLNLNFQLSYPYWYIALCAAVGFLAAFGLYYKEKRFTTGLFWLLSLLRFLSGFIIAFLLLDPVLSWFSTDTKKPCIAILQDNSASQAHALSKINRGDYELKMKGLITALEKDYVVKRYTYGNNLVDTNTLSYDENATNISEAIELATNNHAHENLGAVIITGDGINNAGLHPSMIKLNTQASVYAVGIGDTALTKDAFVAQTFANKIVYRGDQFNAKIDIAGISCNGAAPDVSIFHHNSGKTVFQKKITFSGERSSRQVDAILNASSNGIQHYTAIVNEVVGEKNIVNNKLDFYVEVIESKEKILILANSPHPDINAIQTALTVNKNAEVDIKLAINAGSIKVSDYNLIVLHNLPSMQYKVQELISAAKNQGAGLLYIVGAQTSLAQLNSVQNAVSISSGTGAAAETGSSWNKNFTYFNYYLDEANKLSTLPPLLSPAGQYKIGPNTSVLLYQKIGSSSTANPLIALQQNGNQRVGVITAHGIWRWRLYDYLQHKNQDAVDGLIKKTVQYLSVKQDKKKFRVNCNKNIFNINEPIQFDAELYNDNYELINTGEVTMTVVDNKSNRSTYTFNKQERNFRLQINDLPAGDYIYEAKSNANGIARTVTGTFKVVNIDIEKSNTTADFGGLKILADNHNGKFVLADQVGTLYDMIKKNDQIKNIVREEAHTEPLINWHWLLGLLLGLLSLEWFLRKYNGGI